ncbi:uncharacterized protein Bfra_012091 [Botrytis fragariae]|uniref:Uncharacterized protein n=1 Tax=Botrytis fragariae TaxID=1964551 RepID=A0A8H6AK38_9HELO|nr:uncharacterized protein Bfra_012091 [Botrytis fragariae]KAF5868760.1 hypothetical protein Bfra_012091 [Botrytis fragariae]
MSNRRGGKSSPSSRRPVASNQGPDTVFKEKYGPYPGQPNDRHSGLTPIVPHITRGGVGKVDASTLRREQQQRNAFYNFTAKQLLDLDANITSTRPLKGSDLNIPLLPCFKRDRWKTNGKPYALGQLGPGKWFATNDVVWELLQPTLQLASMLLINIQNDLYDTLLCGKRIPIDPERIPENLPERATPQFLETLFSIKSRGLAPDDPSLQKSKKMLLHALSSFAFLKFKDTSVTFSFNGCTKCGLQRIPDSPPLLHCHIILNHTNLEPLLRPNITASEKLAYQWRVAVTLTHECFHAMFNISDFIRAKRDKILSNWNLGSECGFLMEQVGLGGVTRGEKNPKGSLYPTIALFWTEWPTVYWASYVSNFILKTPALNPRYNFYPIPVTYFEDVHQMTFWLHTVRIFGTKMLALRSNKVRMQVTRLPHFPDAHVLSTDDDEVKHFEWKATHLSLKSKQDMSPDERRACKAGDDLIKRAELNEEFFINSLEQSNQLKAIVDFNKSLKDRLEAFTSDNYTSPGQESRQPDPLEIIKTSMQTQYDMLMSATMAHRAAVDTYFQMAISGDAPIEIKDHLLMFNQGFRGFARQIAHEYWTDELLRDYEDIDEKLEFLRQMLYSPADAKSKKYAMEYEEFGEIAIIMNAYDQFHTEPEYMSQVISQGVEVLETRWRSSRYSRTCANIIKLATSIVNGKTADPFDTINKIDAKIQTLIFLLNGEDNKRCDSWTPTLDDMIKRMRKISSNLFDKVMATGGIEMDEYDPIDEDDISTDNDMDDDNEVDFIPGQPA